MKKQQWAETIVTSETGTNRRHKRNAKLSTILYDTKQKLLRQTHMGMKKL